MLGHRNSTMSSMIILKNAENENLKKDFLFLGRKTEDRKIANKAFQKVIAVKKILRRGL